jgi:Tol biopolymer transport system component
MPDGQNLVYTVKGPDGASVRSINVSTGKVTSLFQSNYTEATVAVSPDGKQVAYEAMLPGDHYSIFVAALDGLNPKLIVDASPIVVTIPYWSPDGKWIVASVHDESFAKYAVLTLVNVKTCQIVPLKSLSGYVSAWIP